MWCLQIYCFYLVTLSIIVLLWSHMNSSIVSSISVENSIEILIEIPLNLSVQFLRCVQLFATPCTAEGQASLSFTISWTLIKPMSIESMDIQRMPSNHLILWGPLLLLPSILPSIRAFSNESALHNRWPKYCSFSFSNSPSNEYSGLISSRIH